MASAVEGFAVTVKTVAPVICDEAGLASSGHGLANRL
jgi:hypothetical protein